MNRYVHVGAGRGGERCLQTIRMSLMIVALVATAGGCSSVTGPLSNGESTANERHAPPPVPSSIQIRRLPVITTGN